MKNLTIRSQQPLISNQSAKVLTVIDELDTEEIIKDILRGWYWLRCGYYAELRKFRIKKLASCARKLAQDLYEKYRKPKGATQIQVVWKEGFKENYYSVGVWDQEINTLLLYPLIILQMEGLNPDIFFQVVLHLRWSATPVNFQQFREIIRQEQQKTQITFSSVDQALLQALFQPFKTRSAIGIPNIPELRKPGWEFANSTARRHMHRLWTTGILTRHSMINYAKLGLTPILTIDEPTNELTATERNYLLWEGNLSPNKTVRILAVPKRSLTWLKSRSAEIEVLQGYARGVNPCLLTEEQWGREKPVQKTLESEKHPIIEKKMDYTGKRIDFQHRDIEILNALRLMRGRRVDELCSFAHYSPGFVSTRLTYLQEKGAFQTTFRINYAGLSERDYILVQGKENEVERLEQIVRSQPQYTLVKGKKRLFAVMYLTPKQSSRMREVCRTDQQIKEIQEFNWGKLQKARSHNPDLERLWDKKKIAWYSEI